MTNPFRLALAAALLFACGALVEAKSPEPPFPQGLYGNVTMGAESGDLGGFEVRFFTDPATAKPMAEFTLCEGWCNTVYTAEVTRTDRGFAFSHVEMLEAYDDSGTLVEEKHLAEYRVIRAGKGWKVYLLYDGNDVTAGEAWRIKPLMEPLGLAVARGEADIDAER
ncbi:hypothetical protein [Erythrobacter sp. CCH5-A1]|uniref:hypothetical protein n=1 Tax=Erythrobacter sp. CCH5-A1 TaxID=1768792 RepID=UPI000830C8F2|nr:hypothetical protein [Erythrobacter sp. CCH5-A1]